MYNFFNKEGIKILYYQPKIKNIPRLRELKFSELEVDSKKGEFKSTRLRVLEILK